MNEKLRFTAWLVPSHIHHGKHGNVSNHYWLLLEKERIESLGQECEVLTGMVGNKTVEALFYKEDHSKTLQTTL